MVGPLHSPLLLFLGSSILINISYLIGSWSQPLEPGTSPASPTILNSNKQETRESLQYSKTDIEHIEKWGMLSSLYFPNLTLYITSSLIASPHTLTHSIHSPHP